MKESNNRKFSSQFHHIEGSEKSGVKAFEVKENHIILEKTEMAALNGKGLST
ncbi:MAG: hypothetical protein ABJA71_06090 [Ginsengibacter sp.]